MVIGCVSGWNAKWAMGTVGMSGIDPEDEEAMLTMHCPTECVMGCALLGPVRSGLMRADEG